MNAWPISRGRAGSENQRQTKYPIFYLDFGQNPAFKVTLRVNDVFGAQAGDISGIILGNFLFQVVDLSSQAQGNRLKQQCILGVYYMLASN